MSYIYRTSIELKKKEKKTQSSGQSKNKQKTIEKKVKALKGCVTPGAER